MLKKLEYLVVALVLILATALRLYRIDFPLADWHSWRQADTAAVARNFVKDRFDLLYPQSDSLLALNGKGLENPDRLFINEFPIYNATVALIYRQLGVNVMYGRLVSVAMSVLGALFLYLLVKRLLGTPTALLTLLYYSVNPYNVFYGRVFMPDPSFVSFSIMSLYWCVRYADSSKLRHGLLMAITFALATLVKPYALMMAIPIFYWLLTSRGVKLFTKPVNYLLLLLALAPITLWRYHLYLHPEGSFTSAWLLNGGDIRFTGAFFRWIIFDRFNRLIFATGGFVLFVVGLFTSYTNKKSSLFFVWALAVFIYITVFAKGNVNHDYYQLPIMPVGAVLVAIGSVALVKLGTNRLQQIINSMMVVVLLVLSIAFGWFEVRGFFNINNIAIVHAGQRIDEITEPDALVIAPYMSDPAFLYQTNRHGWPIGGRINDRIELGADYYVTTTRDEEYNELVAKYTLIDETDLYSIIDLNQPISQ